MSDKHKKTQDRLKNLGNAVDALVDEEEVYTFLRDLLTKAEQETLGMRWEIAKLLDSGVPYTKIEEITGASSATIAKVNEFLKYGYDGYRLAIDRSGQSVDIGGSDK